jgi:hypothetical protein
LKARWNAEISCCYLENTSAWCVAGCSENAHERKCTREIGRESRRSPLCDERARVSHPARAFLRLRTASPSQVQRAGVVTLPRWCALRDQHEVVSGETARRGSPGSPSRSRRELAHLTDAERARRLVSRAGAHPDVRPGYNWPVEGVPRSRCRCQCDRARVWLYGTPPMTGGRW